jgi:hypothetical protein
MQIEVTYALSFNAAHYERECSAKYIMNEVIGTWVQEHDATNSAPLQQAFFGIDNLLGPGKRDKKAATSGQEYTRSAA